MIRKFAFLVLFSLWVVTLGLTQDNTPPTPQTTPSSDQVAPATQEKASTTAKPGQKKEGDEEVPATRKAKRGQATPEQSGTTSTPKPAEKKPADPLTSAETYRGLHMRSIGPAFVSARQP